MASQRGAAGVNRAVLVSLTTETGGGSERDMLTQKIAAELLRVMILACG